MVHTLTRVRLAYLAGLLDGEGHFACVRRKRKGKWWGYTLQVVFHMGTREPLKAVADWLGAVPTTYRSKRRYGEVTMWRLRLPSLYLPKARFLSLLEALIPFLLLKKRQAEIMLEIERVRASGTPGRLHKGKRGFAAMPEAVVNEIEKLRSELYALYSSKRRPRSE